MMNKIHLSLLLFVIMAWSGCAGVTGHYYYRHGQKVPLQPITEKKSVDNHSRRCFSDGTRRLCFGRQIYVRLKPGIKVNTLLKGYDLTLVRKMPQYDLVLFEASSPEKALFIANDLVESGVAVFAHPSISKKIEAR